MIRPSLPAPLLAASLAAVALAACSNAVRNPAYERNPAPRQAYTVTARIQGAPGPFHLAKANVQYVIGPDQACMPAPEPISGASPTPDRYDFDVPVRKLSDTEYQFEVFLDGMVAKDYFGRGVCGWRVEFASITFKPSAAEDGYWIRADLRHEQVVAQAPVPQYAKLGLYSALPPDPVLANESALDEKDFMTRYGTAPVDAFSITLQARAAGGVAMPPPAPAPAG